MDFEQNKHQGQLPDHWVPWGLYPLLKDTSIRYSGNYSVCIESAQPGPFGSMAYKIRAQYEGEVVRLEGYMKPENVSDGFAGFLLRLNGDSKVLAFDNMQRLNIHGTIDWKKYRIELPYSEEAENIFVAGIFNRKRESLV